MTKKKIVKKKTAHARPLTKKKAGKVTPKKAAPKKLPSKESSAKPASSKAPKEKSLKPVFSTLKVLTSETPLFVSEIHAKLDKILELLKNQTATPKTKKAIKEEKPAPIEEPNLFNEENQSAPSLTHEDLTQALQKVVTLRGLDSGKQCLASFNAKKISDIKEKYFEDFVDLCEVTVREDERSLSAPDSGDEFGGLF